MLHLLFNKDATEKSNFEFLFGQFWINKKTL